MDNDACEPGRGDRARDPWEGADAEAVAQAARRQAERPVPGIEDMAACLAAQVADGSHREVIGPLLDGQGASGVIVRRGTVIASWGDPTRVEMAYSATKSVLSLVAGIAHDDGLLIDGARVPVVSGGRRTFGCEGGEGPLPEGDHAACVAEDAGVGRGRWFPVGAAGHAVRPAGRNSRWARSHLSKSLAGAVSSQPRGAARCAGDS
ncbi:hypothetical protein AB0G77_34690 [Streptomyces hygroscopicus]|uniref:hypothetical protein n=1 Tax=Streptomyces hygroscopicus TaxID=1912 RepID=UPI00340A518A